MSWADFEAAVEQLASARAAEQRRADRTTRQRDKTKDDLGRVSDKLASQRRAILSLADQLQVTRPALDGADRTGIGLQDALHRAENDLHRAESLYAEAESATRRTRLFPDMSRTRRNLLVYCACATLTALATYCGFLVGSVIAGPQVWSAHLALLPLLLPPAVAVMLGCAIINTVGRPQLPRYTIKDFMVIRGFLISFVLCLVLQSVLDLLR